MTCAVFSEWGRVRTAGTIVAATIVGLTAPAFAAEPPPYVQEAQTVDGASKTRKLPDRGFAEWKQAKAGAELAKVDRAKKQAASAKAAEANKQAQVTNAATPKQGPDPNWAELWRLQVGKTGPMRHQIAARGPLIAVATFGTDPDGADGADGVHIVDGRHPTKTVRIIRPPDATFAGATGVALDEDDVVFGWFEAPSTKAAGPAGHLTKARLDGTAQWNSKPAGMPGLPQLFDFNGDGVKDVLLLSWPMTGCERDPTQCRKTEPVPVIATVFDGRDGKTLWTRDVGADFKPQAPVRGFFASIDRGNGHPQICVAARLQDVTGRTPRQLVAALARDTGQPSPPEYASFCRPEAYPETLFPPTYLGSALTPASAAVLGTFAVRAQQAELQMIAGQGSSIRISPLDDPLLVSAVSVPGPIVTAPTLGDIDLNGEWDVLVVVDDMLMAFGTKSKGDIQRALWQGDLAATGAPPTHRDHPRAYASRVRPRDRERWLLPDADPSDKVFQILAENLDFTNKGPMSADLLLGLPGPHQEAAHCGQRTFASVEGTLLAEAVGGDRAWGHVSGAPRPIRRLACAPDGALILEVANGKTYLLPAPPDWRGWARALLAVLGVGLGLAVLLRWRSIRKLAAHGVLESNVRLRFQPDQPLNRRALLSPEQGALADGLVNFIDNDDTRPPVTVAVCGPWGSGKSSVMEVVRGQLRDTGRYIDIWFNAWRFHREEQLAPALLQSIVEEVRKQAGPLTFLRVALSRLATATAGDLLKAILPACAVAGVFALCVRQIAMSGASGGGYGSLTGFIGSGAALMVGFWRRILMPLLTVFSLEPAKLLGGGDPGKRIDFIREFGRDFSRVLRFLRPEQRVIVFVDDLDRCPPDRIADALETMNMLAATERCFFVLAIDPVIVRRAVELRYEDMLTLMRDQGAVDEAADFGAQYLDKMVTVAVSVPLVSGPHLDRPEDESRQPDPSRGARLVTVGRRCLDIALPRLGTWVFTLACTLLMFLGGYRAIEAFGPGAMGKLIGDLVIGPAEGDKPGKEEAGGDRATAPDTDGKVARDSRTPTVNPVAAAPSPAVPTATPDLPVSASPGGKARVESPSDDAQPKTVLVFDAVSSVPLAPVELPLPALATEGIVAQRSATEGQAGARWFLRGIEALTLLGGLGILVWLLSTMRRSARMSSARRPAHDSTLFAAALAAARNGLNSNPRDAIRFSNAARLLYHLIRTTEGQARADAWEADFFAHLVPRWKRHPATPSTGHAAWISARLDAWFPAVRVDPAGARGPAASPGVAPRADA